MRYRADIDGLRAIAIIPVILFHLAVPGFGGGFVGVDIFFVISGFLITSIIYREIEDDKFSFIQFYERRIRRIFPALFFVLIISVLISLFILLPKDMRAFSKSLVAATVFAANLLFWKQGGYFDSQAIEKPLLHTWSLSVEEQFYIAFPILFLLLTRTMPKRVSFILIGLMLASFAAATLQYPFRLFSPLTIFYLPVFRAWELLLGGVLALNIIPNPFTHRQRNLFSLIGLTLIVYSVYQPFTASVFHAANLLYPCLGAALVIYAGSGGYSSVVGKVLGWRPLVLIGLISYSLYLWHWPLIVFAKYYLVRDLLPIDKVYIFAASLFLATLTWRYVERPFRSKTGSISRSTILKLSLASVIALISFGLVGYFTGGIPQRIPTHVIPTDHRISHNPVSPLPESNKRLPIYAVGTTGGDAPSFLVWGDSHAEVLLEMFDEAAKEESKSGLVIAMSACRPLIGVGHCTDAALPFIERHPTIKTVILVAKWGFTANGYVYKRGGVRPEVFPPAYEKKINERFQKGLKLTIQYLLARHVHVIFMNDVPEVGWDVATLRRSKWFGRKHPYQPPTYAEYLTCQKPVFDALHRLHDLDFRIIDLAPLFCSSGTCMVEKDGFTLYMDDNHLSAKGAEIVLPQIRKILALTD